MLASYIGDVSYRRCKLKEVSRVFKEEVIEKMINHISWPSHLSRDYKMSKWSHGQDQKTSIMIFENAKLTQKPLTSFVWEIVSPRLTTRKL